MNPTKFSIFILVLPGVQALREILTWIRAKKNSSLVAGSTGRESESVRWLSYLFLGNSTGPGAGAGAGPADKYSSVLCFIISTLIVFIFSLLVALAVLRCYDFYRTRSQVQRTSSRLYDTP